ncbi:unnamed protein product [Urochloa humidicola]
MCKKRGFHHLHPNGRGGVRTSKLISGQDGPEIVPDAARRKVPPPLLCMPQQRTRKKFKTCPMPMPFTIAVGWCHHETQTQSDQKDGRNMMD